MRGAKELYTPEVKKKKWLIFIIYMLIFIIYMLIFIIYMLILIIYYSIIQLYIIFIILHKLKYRFFYEI
jgi:accessory gene regulator protein AgrB